MDEEEAQSFLEELLEKNLSARFSYTAVFDTHPPDESNNTGNLFNFVPHGHLVVRHSSVGVDLNLGNPDPGATTVFLGLRFRPSGVVAEDESGEAHHVIAKVVDRNIIEPALRKVFRRKLGEVFVRTLDKTVVDKISDRIASEVLSQVPATASIREFVVEIAHFFDEERALRVRLGIFQPSIGSPRDEAGRSRLDEKLIAAPDLQYAMIHPGNTLAAEVTYLVRLDGELTMRLTAGIQQAQDPDATLGLAFRNALFDEGSTELSLRKMDSPYIRLVLSNKRWEAYASAADSEGPSVAGGIFYQATERFAVAAELALHEPDEGELSLFEEWAETTYRHGVSLTLMHDFGEKFTAYLNGQSLEGTVGRKKEFFLDKVEAGVVYRFHKAMRVGISAYSLEKDDNTDTGLKLGFSANF